MPCLGITKCFFITTVSTIQLGEKGSIEDQETSDQLEVAKQ